MEHDVDAELLRCRDRLHALEGTVPGLNLRVGAAERAIDRLVEEIRPVIDEHRQARAVARARYSWLELALGSTVTLCTIASLIIGLMR